MGGIKHMPRDRGETIHTTKAGPRPYPRGMPKFFIIVYKDGSVALALKLRGQR